MIEFALVRGGEIIRHHMFAEGEEPPTLAPNKGAWLPVVAEDPPFNPITQVKAEPELQVEDDRVVQFAAVRDKTPEEVAAMRALKVADIKGQAGDRILALYPDWKQRNMTARAVELVRARQDRALASDEASEEADLIAAFDTIKAIRVRSNDLEAALPPTDPVLIDAFNPAEGWD